MSHQWVVACWGAFFLFYNIHLNCGMSFPEAKFFLQVFVVKAKVGKVETLVVHTGARHVRIFADDVNHSENVFADIVKQTFIVYVCLFVKGRCGFQPLTCRCC